MRLLEDRERLEANLIDFFEAAWPHFDPAPFVPGWHLGAIAEHLQAVAEGQIRRLLINVPPRHSKTLITSVAFPAWVWARCPDRDIPLIGPQVKFMCLSYGDDLAMDNATLARRLVSSEWYQQRWGDRVKIARDQDAKNKFDTTAGGTRISASFGAGVLGRGADIKIIDDPHKVDEAESELTRERVIRTYDGTLKSRVTDPRISAEITIMQRLHEADLSGHILDDEDVVHLMLPAEYDPARHCVTVLGWEDPRTDEGDMLWPRRFGPDELAPFKRNPYEWSGQWQQQPVPRGGGIIKRDWWQLWDGDVARKYGLDWFDDELNEDGSIRERGNKEFPPFDLVIASLDTAYTTKTENDPSALTVWGGWHDKQGNRKWMLAFAWEERLELHTLVKKTAETCNKYKVDRLLIEAKASGHSVAQEIARLYGREKFGVQLIDPKQTDKVARAHSVVAMFAGNMVWAPETRWSDRVIDQCTSFPRASHDDLVDSVTQALRWLRDNGVAVMNFEREAEIEDFATYKKPVAPLYDV